MPLGTILLYSPGWNEGKARYETLGIHERKVILSSFRSGTNSASVGALALGLCRPYGAQKKCISMLNPGLAPWAMQGYRPYRALLSKCVVLVSVSVRTCVSECVVLVSVSVRTCVSECVVLTSVFTRTYIRECAYLFQ